MESDATLKHFAVHSGPEGLRHGFDAKTTHKDLYKTYLWVFRYCIEQADPSAVMGAYNRVNGEPACGSEWLLKDVLRDEFGFQGYVASDCGAIRDFHQNHGVTRDYAVSAALAVNNGCHLNCGMAYQYLKVGTYDTNYTVLKFEYIPHKSLCGFEKIFLKAGETVRVVFDSANTL